MLVTGANGFIGSHVADQLIQAGYRVRGTSRDTTKTAWITEMFDKRYGEGKFEAVVVKDMAESGAFDEACKGVSGVAHVASVLTFDSDPNKVIPTVVNGAVNAATSAAKQTSVKRFVYTSSSTAITAPRPNVEITISTENWNNEDVKAAWEPPPFEAKGAWSPYGASKTQAEQEMWKFVKEHEPGFVLNAVLPNTNMGEILSDKQPASTGGWVRSVYNRNLNAVKDVPPQWSKTFPSPWPSYSYRYWSLKTRCRSGLTPKTAPQLDLYFKADLLS